MQGTRGCAGGICVPWGYVCVPKGIHVPRGCESAQGRGYVLEVHECHGLWVLGCQVHWCQAHGVLGSVGAKHTGCQGL